jgi:hypothetical protein
MTRIESENRKSNQLDEMENEIERLKKQLKHKQSKKFFNCGSCLIIFIIILLVLSAGAGFVMAKSGLWQMPGLTSYFYREPAPIYQVKSSEFNDNSLINRIKAVAVSEAIKQRKSSNLAISFELSEEELSALLRTQLLKNKSLAEQVNYLQIALAPGQAQLFVRANNPKGLIVTLDFKPVVADGKLNFQVKSFKVGDLDLPGFFGKILVENIGAKTLNSILNSLSLVGKIDEINLGDRKVGLKLLINTLNF